jgi:ParB family chromosome partitioning protein
MVQHNITHEKLAEETGKSRSSVSNILRLLKLPEEIQQAVREKKISGGHARAILGAAGEEAQRALLKRILEEDLNVRQTEELANGQKKPQEKKKIKRTAGEHDLLELEGRLTRHFKTKVEIRLSGKKGRIIIHFLDAPDLNRITELLK